MLFECTGICILSSAHECEIKGSFVYLLIANYLSHRVCLKLATVYQTVVEWGGGGGGVRKKKKGFRGVCRPRQYHLQGLYSKSELICFLQSGLLAFLGYNAEVHLTQGEERQRVQQQQSAFLCTRTVRHNVQVQRHPPPQASCTFVLSDFFFFVVIIKDLSFTSRTQKKKNHPLFDMGC